MIPYAREFFILHYQLSLFLTSLTAFSLGCFILVKNSRHVVNRSFAVFMVCSGVWSFTQALIGTWPNPVAWLPIAQVEHMAHVFIPTTFLHFVHALIGLQQPRRVVVSYVMSAAFLCFIPTSLFIRSVDPTSFAKFVLDAGPVYPAYTIWFIATVIEALVKLSRAISVNSDDPIERHKLKLVFWATIIGFAGGLPNFLYVFHIDLYPILPFCTYIVPIYPVVIVYAIFRHQLLDIRIVVKKSLAYSLLIGVITGVYFSFVLVAEKLLQGVMGYRSLIGSLLGGFVIALGFNPLKELIQRFIDQLFFRGSQPVLAAENERLRQELTRSEKLKAVATLAAGMAHEIKNPLASIKTFAEFLPQRYDDPAFREMFAKVMSQEVDKINSLVHRLLDFARPAQPHLEPVRLSTLVKETVDVLHGSFLKQQVHVETQFAEQDAVCADAAQMKQVILNLLLNSLEAIDSPGQITVSTVRNNGHLDVVVTDTGHGISRKDLHHIFDPFYTTKPSGTGLGLSVVHSIVREHGGRIRVQSAAGQGTTVRVSLPLNGRD